MNRKNFFKTLGAGILATIFIPNKLFSKNKSEVTELPKQSEDKLPFQFIIINKNGNHQITHLLRGNKYIREIDSEICLIRIHNLSNTYNHDIFYHNDVQIITQSYINSGQFMSPINDIPYSVFVKNINEFKFNFRENETILFTLFPRQRASRTLTSQTPTNNSTQHSINTFKD